MTRPAESLACALLAFLVGLTGVLQDAAVLCVGPDGRSAVEVPAAAREPSSDSGRGAEPTASPDDCACLDGCGPCEDTPLERERVVLRARPDGDGSRPADIVTRCPVRRLEVHAPGPLARGSSLEVTPPTHAAVRRTTVLLI